MRFRYQSVLRNINLAIQPRRDGLHHRRERLRQDGDAQADHRPACGPREGSVWFDGRDVADSRRQAARQDAAAVRVSVPDGRALRQPDGLRQRRLRPARAPTSATRRTSRQIVAERLHEVGLPSEIEAKKPAELSGGQRKRVGLARALAIGPEVMLYDEPTTGLDPIMSDVINELILQTQRTKKTTGVVVTHDMKTVAKVADRVVMLYPLARLEPDEPQILYDGPPEELESCPDPRVGQFVRGEAGERLREMALLRTTTSAGRRVRQAHAEPRTAKTRVIMNERLMQFRIGMFVIVAGLVLTMMIVWFGESPAILRDQVYLKVHYAEAPGRARGRSGPQERHPDRRGLRDRVRRAAQPARRRARDPGAGTKIQAPRGHGPAAVAVVDRRRDDRHAARDRPGVLATGKSPADAPVIEGEVAPDPSKALEAATKVFDSAGDTLKSINEAASGLAKLTKSAEKLDDFLTSVADAGKNVSKAAQRIDGSSSKANEANFKPALADLRQVAAKLNATFDPATQAALKTGLDRFSSAAAELDSGLAQLDPVLKDLGAPVNHHAGHRHRPGRQADQRAGRRPRALDQQAPRRPRRPEHRRHAPEAAHPGRAARQLEQRGGLGEPDPRAAQGRPGRPASLRRESLPRSGRHRPRCISGQVVRPGRMTDSSRPGLAPLPA